MLSYDKVEPIKWAVDVLDIFETITQSMSSEKNPAISSVIVMCEEIIGRIKAMEKDVFLCGMFIILLRILINTIFRLLSTIFIHSLPLPSSLNESSPP